ncbi:MAG: response regulator transcription factor [Bacteroidales bacterium]|nr:response regulator transcription factor [Candidatus Colimorpha merdihippi]
MKPKINVLIAEPSDIIREGLATILGSDEFALLAPMRDIPADIDLRIPHLQPDVLLLNPTLLHSPAKMQLASICQARPQMGVVALVYQYVEPQLLQSFKAVLDIREQASHVAQILRDSSPMHDESPEENYDLSERENEVLVLVAKGLSSKEIADQLCISIHTVNTHRKNITHKTGIKSVAGLAVYAMLHNLV